MTEFRNQHEAFESILKETLPGVLVFQANMPFVKMDELAKASVKTVTYLFFTDRPRVTTSGASGVHDVVIEVNVFGQLDEIDKMAAALNSVFLDDDVTADRWTFSLVVDQDGQKDIWEPGIKAKRVFIRYRGLMIEEAE